MEADLFDGDTNVENRIPFDILEMPDAETIYRNHLNQIHAHHKRLEWVILLWHIKKWFSEHLNICTNAIEHYSNQQFD